MRIDLRNLPKITNDAYVPLYHDRHRYLNLRGGGGSGKSVWAATKVVLRVISEPDHNMGVFRKVGKTIKGSVWGSISEATHRLGVHSLFDTHKTDRVMTFRPNKNRIMFLGLDDPEKIKSISDDRGLNLTSAWIEEATDLYPEDFTQIDLRLRGRCKTYRQIILSYNPVSSSHWIKKRFWDREDENCLNVVTTYRDNRFIDEEYKRVLENLKFEDPTLHRIYALGEWGELTGLIYGVPEVGECPGAADECYLGVDFGFNNPSVMVLIQVKDEIYYITEIVYQSGLTDANFAKLCWQEIKSLRSKGILLYDPHVYADPENPGGIAELESVGFNVTKADKRPGSVIAGIQMLKKTKKRTKVENENINKEFGTYKWKVDNTGSPMDQPVKFMDHAMDAIRYAIWTHNVDRVSSGGFDGHVERIPSCRNVVRW